MRPVLFGVLTALIASTILADPQAADVPPVTTLHAEARVVQIDVVVTDSQGKPVTDLSKQDFTITDEGKARAIDIFSINRGDAVRVQSSSPAVPKLPPHMFSNRNAGPPDLPRHSTVIILDQVSTNPATGPDPRNTFQDDAYAQLQVAALMNQVNPDEEIALYVIAGKLGLVLLQDYTTNRELLLSRLNKYLPRDVHGDIHTYKEKPTSTPGPTRRDPAASSPRETEFLRVGEVHQVRLSFQALAEHLALVPGRKSVFWLSEWFLCRNACVAWSKWHVDKTITALNEANVAVNTVDSVGNPGNNYRPPGSFKEIAESTGGQAWEYRNDLDHAMADATPGTPRGTLNIRLNLDPGTLSLKEKVGGWTGKVEETFVEVNESGNTLSKVSDIKQFEVTPANRATYDAQGVAWPLSVPLMSGAVKMTIIVRDSATGHVGSLTVPLK